MSDTEPDLVREWDTALTDSRFKDSVSAARALAEKLTKRAAVGDPDDPDIARLFSLAEAFLAAGRYREVLALVGPVVGPDPTSGQASAGVVAQAALLQGMALRKLGRLREAVGAFDRCAKACAAEDFEGRAGLWVYALFYKAALILELSGDVDMPLVEQATSAYQELEQRFEHNDEVPVRSLVAQAYYNHANALGTLTRPRDAAAHFGKALEVAAGLSDDALPPGFVAFTRLRQRRIAAVDVPEAAGEAHTMKAEINNLRVQEEFARQEARRSLVVAPDKVMSWREAAAELAETLLSGRIRLGVIERLAAVKHERARKILCETQMSLAPFILMLRNFDYNSTTRAIPFPPNWDRKQNPLDTRLSAITMTVANLSKGPFEEPLTESLSRFAPVISVANPSDWGMETDFRADLPTLYLADEAWMSTVRGLIDVADVILVRLAFMTPGVTEELAYIEQIGAHDRTVLLIPAAADMEHWKSIMTMMGKVTSQDLLPAPEADLKALSSRFHVLTDAEVLVGQPGLSAPLADAIDKVLKIKKMTPEQRLEHFTAQLDSSAR
jgi:tetratricopeptide (TPR) repeat protein